jgi:hypothetical protein
MSRVLENIGSSCFLFCHPLSSISFESNSRLIRIESSPFSFSSLQSIEIPRNVQCIDDSAFEGIKSICVSSALDHKRFSIEKNAHVAIFGQRLTRHFSLSSWISICADIEILGSSCFSNCKLDQVYSLQKKPPKANSRMHDSTRASGMSSRF